MKTSRPHPPLPPAGLPVRGPKPPPLRPRPARKVIPFADPARRAPSRVPLPA